ncbi:MAG: CBS domain-containing protein [Parcubacteria group bacterium]
MPYKTEASDTGADILVRDFMTKHVITISPERSIIEAAQILFEHNFDGLPVTDDSNRLVGIITQYDLVSKGAKIHLPTFIQLMKELPVYKKDKGMIRPGLENIVSLKVADVMNAEPITIEPGRPVEDASMMFTEHHGVNPIPVVDVNRQLVGIISRYDIMRLYTGSMGAAAKISQESSIERKVDVFMKQFRKRFVVVSKFRTHFWFISSVIFALVGFIIAFLIITRIQVY